MSRPPKPASMIKLEGKSHRTKKELEVREKAEAALSSGKAITERAEVKNNAVAHEEFLRVRAELRKIHKNDALYTAVVNRYCLLYSECIEYENLKNKELEQLETLREDFKEIKFSSAKARYTALIELTKTAEKLHRQILSYDSAIMSKRKMMFDIEKENVMTVSSALRSIPKAPDEKENKLLAALQDDD